MLGNYTYNTPIFHLYVFNGKYHNESVFLRCFLYICKKQMIIVELM